jgi:hypothetical protein
MTKFPGSGCFWSLEVAPAGGLISIPGIALLALSNFTPRSAVRACRQRCYWSWAPRSRPSADRRVHKAHAVLAALQAPSVSTAGLRCSAAYSGGLKASEIGRELGYEGLFTNPHACDLYRCACEKMPTLMGLVRGLIVSEGGLAH